MSPVLTEKEAAESGAKGRAYDYQTGINLQTTQSRSSDTSTSFQELRALADAWPVLRMVMESRKDKVSKLKNTFQLRDPLARKAQQKSGKPDPRIQLLYDFFEQPDRINDGSLWTRQILEDLYVLDACAILPRMTYGGQLYSLDLLDAATIVRRVSLDGRTPLPPDPAYTQMLKGVPAVDYCLATGAKDWKRYPHDQLIYLCSNPRTHRLYGYSRVEQIDVYVNMALRRMTSQLYYFTEGDMPDWIATANKDWSPEQIERYWTIWDAKKSGNLAERRKLTLLPGGTSEPKAMKEPPLNNEFDLFMAKVAGYCFSESPQWLERMMTRATAGTAQEEAKIEGVSVDAEFLSRLKTRIIRQWFGWPDIECVLENDLHPDPKTQAEIDAVYIAHGVYSPDYVTDRVGVPEDAKPGRLLVVGGTVQTLEGVSGGRALNPKAPVKDAAAAPGASFAKAKRKAIKGKVLEPLLHDRKAVRIARAAIAGELKRVFAAARPAAVKAMVAAYGLHQKFRKDESGGDKDRRLTRDVELILAAWTFAEFEAFYAATSNALAVLAQDAATRACAQVGVAETGEIVTLARREAEAWAMQRAAQMVGMKLVGGQLVADGSAQWAITEGTMGLLRQTVRRAMDNGWTAERLGEAINENRAWSVERAQAIAADESRSADVNGGLIGYRNAGTVIGLKWMLDGDPCEKCIANYDQGYGGIIPITEEWLYPYPVHPNEMCDIAPVVSED